MQVSENHHNGDDGEEAARARSSRAFLGRATQRHVSMNRPIATPASIIGLAATGVRSCC